MFEKAARKSRPGMTQRWERSPPTNVSRVRFLDPASYVGWVCCWFSSLLREVFLRVLRFSPLLKNQHFQIPIRSWNARTFLNEFLWTPWCSVGKQITFTFTFFFSPWLPFLLIFYSSFSFLLSNYQEKSKISLKRGRLGKKTLSSVHKEEYVNVNESKETAPILNLTSWETLRFPKVILIGSLKY